MSSALNGRSALQHFERSNAIEIYNGIMFDFYPGLPHMCMGSKNNHKATHTCVNVVEVTGYGMGRGQGPYGISTVDCGLLILDPDHAPFHFP